MLFEFSDIVSLHHQTGKYVYLGVPYLSSQTTARTNLIKDCQNHGKMMRILDAQKIITSLKYRRRLSRALRQSVRKKGKTVKLTASSSGKILLFDIHGGQESLLSKGGTSGTVHCFAVYSFCARFDFYWFDTADTVNSGVQI